MESVRRYGMTHCDKVQCLSNFHDRDVVLVHRHRKQYHSSYYELDVFAGNDSRLLSGFPFETFVFGIVREMARTISICSSRVCAELLLFCYIFESCMLPVILKLISSVGECYCWNEVHWINFWESIVWPTVDHRCMLWASFRFSLCRHHTTCLFHTTKKIAVKCGTTSVRSNADWRRGTYNKQWHK